MHGLTDIIKQGESETLEFKPAFNADVIETAVAFANTRGGRILLGFSDAGQPLPATFGKEALRDYVNRIATATEPSVIPEAELVQHSHNDVIILTIPEFPLKPVATRGRCYRRSGSITRQMTPSEIAEMHLHSTGQSMDAVIVADRTLADLDLDAVRTYMRRATDQGRRSFTETQDPRTVLRNSTSSNPSTKSPAPPFFSLGKTRNPPLVKPSYTRDAYARKPTSWITPLSTAPLSARSIRPLSS